MIKDLPEKLQKLRLQMGYSQKQIADMIKVSPSIISGYETGERTPSTDNLLMLSYLYSVSTDYLLGRISNDPETMLDISGLSDKEIIAVRNLVDAMKDNK